VSRGHRRSGSHLATLAYEGRIWDAYLDFETDALGPDTYRARLRFDSPEGAEPLRTAVIIIEDSFEQAVAAARALDERQLEGLLRSLLPEDPADPS
jgi:hypothetical protein